MDVEFDALTQDVSMGGMRSKYGIKILLCYLLKYFDSTISRKAFIEILREGELVNYFEIGPALNALVDLGLIECIRREDDDYFKITPDGIWVTEKLQSDIFIGAKEKAVNIAAGVIAREKRKGTVDYKIDKIDNGYLVIMTVLDKGEIMMQAKLFAGDYVQARLVGEKFMDNPQKLYNSIIDALTL